MSSPSNCAQGYRSGGRTHAMTRCRTKSVRIVNRPQLTLQFERLNMEQVRERLAVIASR
jgi:hypothetical protein